MFVGKGMAERPGDLKLLAIGERYGPNPHLRLRPHNATYCALAIVDDRHSNLSREQLIGRAELDRLIQGDSLVREYVSIQPTRDGASVRFLGERGDLHEAMVESDELRAWLSTWARNLGL